MIRRIMTLIFCIAVVFGTYPTINCAAEESDRTILYVAVSGRDTNEGTIENPLATMEGAKNKIKALKASGVSPKKGFVVYFRGGNYSFEKGVTFEEADSGTISAPVVYRSYPGEKAILLGGVSISGSEFKKVTDTAVLERVIDTNARRELMHVNLNDLGYGNYGGIYLYGVYSYSHFNDENPAPKGWEKPAAFPPEFFLDGEALKIARYPNKDYVYIENIIDAGHNNDWERDRPGAYTTNRLVPFKVTFKDERIKRWQSAAQPMMYGFPAYHWAEQSFPVSIDAKSGVVTAEWSSSFGVKLNQPVYFYNLLEEIDEPGEYYLDHKTGDLYVYPTVSLTDRTIRMSVLEKPLITIEGASYIHFKNFEISATRTNAIIIDGGEANLVSDCEISLTADYPIRIQGTSKNNGVKNCYFHDVNGGVAFSAGDVRTITPGNNYVVNNHFENFDRINKNYRPAVSMYGVDDLFAYNEVHGADHTAVIIAGLKNKIYYNEIYDVLKDTDDAGAIYGGQSWLTGRGTEIKYNYIHDINGNDVSRGSHGLAAVYLDGGQCEVMMVGNVVENAEYAFWINGGWHSLVYNNITINTTALRMQAIMHLANENDAMGTAKGISDPHYHTGIWKQEFPGVKEMAMESLAVQNHPKHNYYENNLIVKGAAAAFFGGPSAEQNLNAKNNYETKVDPGFYDYDNKNYMLLADSEVFSKLPDFIPPPFTRMGTNYTRAKNRIRNAVVLGLDSPYGFINGIKTQIDNENLNVLTKLIDSKTYVPLRFIAEALDCEVTFDDKTREIALANSLITLKLTVDSTSALKNGEDIAMESAAYIINGRTMIPLREVSNLFGKQVFWDDMGLIAISDQDAIFDTEHNSDDDIITYLYEQLSIS